MIPRWARRTVLGTWNNLTNRLFRLLNMSKGSIPNIV